METTNSVPETFQGKNPHTTYGSINRLFVEMALQKADARKLDDNFLEQKAREESRYFSKVSRVLIGLWELTAIIMKRKPGEVIVIDADSGRMFTGRISTQKLEEKFHELPQKVAGRVSLEIDGNGRNEKILAHSMPTIYGNSRSKTWNTSTRQAPIESASPIVYFFEQELEKTPKANVYCNTYDKDGETFYEVFIENFPVAIGYRRSTKKACYVISKDTRTNIG